MMSSDGGGSVSSVGSGMSGDTEPPLLVEIVQE